MSVDGLRLRLAPQPCTLPLKHKQTAENYRKYFSRAPNKFWTDLPKFGGQLKPDGEELGPDGGHLTWVGRKLEHKSSDRCRIGSRASSAESFGLQKSGREFLTERISYKRWTCLAFGRQIHIIQIHVHIQTVVFVPINSIFH